MADRLNAVFKKKDNWSEYNNPRIAEVLNKGTGTKLTGEHFEDLLEKYKTQEIAPI